MSKSRNSRNAADCAGPAHRIHEQRDQHTHDFVDDNLTGIRTAEMLFCLRAAPGADREQHPDRNGLRERGLREESPQDSPAAEPNVPGATGM